MRSYYLLIETTLAGHSLCDDDTVATLTASGSDQPLVRQSYHYDHGGPPPRSNVPVAASPTSAAPSGSCVSNVADVVTGGPTSVVDIGLDV